MVDFQKTLFLDFREMFYFKEFSAYEQNYYFKNRV